jgi:hypothetical protein
MSPGWIVLILTSISIFLIGKDLDLHKNINNEGFIKFFKTHILGIKIKN